MNALATTLSARNQRTALTTARDEALKRLVARGIRDPRVLAAIAAVPREAFIPGYHTPAEIYGDRPLPIGHGQTISSLYMQASMLEAAELRPLDRVLDVGTGTGYQSALLAQMGVEVWSLETVPELSDQARETLRATHCDRVHVLLGNGSKGYPPAAAYDAILVCAATPEIPAALVQQLAEGGRLVVPVGTRTNQRLIKLTRRQQSLHVETLGESSFLSTLSA